MAARLGRFTLRVNDEELAMIARWAASCERSQSDAVRFLIRENDRQCFGVAEVAQNNAAVPASSFAPGRVRSPAGARRLAEELRPDHV